MGNTEKGYKEPAERNSRTCNTHERLLNSVMRKIQTRTELAQHPGKNPSLMPCWWELGSNYDNHTFHVIEAFLYGNILQKQACV